MNRSREIFKNAPDTTSKVEIEDIAVVDLGNGMDMVALERHSEEQHLKDGTQKPRIMYRVKGGNLCRKRRRKNSEARLHRHCEDECKCQGKYLRGLGNGSSMQ